MLRLEQAKVKIHDNSWQEANDLTLFLLNNNGAFLHHFDNHLVWQGHSTMIDEIYESGLKPDAVVLSVGSGMLSGVGEGL